MHQAACGSRNSQISGSPVTAPEAVDWLRHIRTAQQLGFSLKEIEADLPLLAAPEGSAEQLREALQAKLAELDQRIAALTALRGELARRLGESMAECPLR